MTDFKTPRLLYNLDDLCPYIDKETMEVHIQKHKGYTQSFNALKDIPDASVHDILCGVSNTLGESARFFGGGHYNHCLYFELMSPNPSKMSELVNQRITHDFGNYENFYNEFVAKSCQIHGSGWTFWIHDFEKQKSEIVTTANQDNPIMDNKNCVCLIAFDMWEHAYLMKYKNDKKGYIENWFKVLDWGKVSKIHDELAINKKHLEVSNDGYMIFN